MIALLFCALCQVATDKIPHLPDETTLVRVKADPAQYAGEEIVICGGLSIADYYNYSYDDLDASHYSFKFLELGERLRDLGVEDCHVYAPRNARWKVVAEKLIANSEKNKTQARAVVVRMKVVLNERAYKSSGQWDLLDAIDVQFVNEKRTGWGPWFGDIEREQEAKDAALAKAAKARRDAFAAEVAAKEKVAADALEKLKWRTWQIGGKGVVAKYNGINAGQLKLLTENGTAHKLPVDKLTKDEQEWLARKPWLPKKTIPLKAAPKTPVDKTPAKQPKVRF